MKIALIGASGNVGSRINAELSSRGHKITAIARGVGKIAVLPGVTPTAVDIANTEALSAALKGHAAVISSVHFNESDPEQCDARQADCEAHAAHDAETPSTGHQFQSAPCGLAAFG